MTKFRLKKEFHDSVRNLFHDDYANKIIHMKEGQDFFIDRGFSLDKIEKVKEITPIEELMNVLSIHFKEVANNNVIDKEYWIEKANKFRSNSIIDVLRVFVDYVNKKQPSYGHIPDEWIRDFAVEDNEMIVYKSSMDDYTQGWEDGIHYQRSLAYKKAKDIIYNALPSYQKIEEMLEDERLTQQEIVVFKDGAKRLRDYLQEKIIKE
jgi:hypothetical protein